MTSNTTENKILPEGLDVPNHKTGERWFKAIVLGIFTVAFFALTWWLMGLGLTDPHTLIFWLFTTLAASIAFSFFTFLAVVDLSPALFWIVNFAILGIYIAILPKEIPVFAGGLVFFVLSYAFARQIKDDEHSRVDFSIGRIVRSGISLLIYGLLIVLGFNIYGAIQGSFQKNPDAVYDKIGHYVSLGLNYVPNGFGDYDPNQTFNDFVVKQADAEEPAITQAPPPAKEAFYDQFKNQLEDKFNIHVSGNPLLGDVVAGVVASKLKEAGNSYVQFFPAIFAIVIVFLLSYIRFLFVWLTSFFSWILFRFLLMIKFFRIEKVQVTVDKLQI